jgi:C-terminal peptidase prc
MQRIALFSLALSFPFLAFAEKKTPEQYWMETGLTTEVVEKQLDLFAPENCTRNLESFRGCVAGVNAVGGLAEPPLRLVPTSVAAEVGATVEDIGYFRLVNVREEASTDESFRATWEKQEARRKKFNAEVEKIFATRKVGNFSAVFRYVVQRSVPDRARDPLAASLAVSAYAQEAIDAHARIEAYAQMVDSQTDTDESFSGIGATLQALDSKIVITAPIEGSPAEKAGIRPNDLILAVDGKSTEGMKLDAVVKLIRGPRGSTVQLKIRRSGAEILIGIERGDIRLENVEAKVVSQLGSPVGLVRLRSFVDQNACRVIEEKVAELQKQGVRGLVLDLRGNGGGLLSQAICIGGLFVGQKVIVKVKDLNRDLFESHIAKNGLVTNLPLVILIDAGSASASEIVSGALQDHQRAWLVGERSFGKGTVQAPEPFFNQRIMLFRAIQRFYQPSGRTNQISGISPDFETAVKPNATADDRFRLREGDFYANSLGAEGPKWQQARPERVASIGGCVTRGQLAEKAYRAAGGKGQLADYQLLVAQEVLLCDK